MSGAHPGEVQASMTTHTSSGSHSSGSAAASSGQKPRSGKGSRGPRPRLFKKNACQADGCSADLSGLPRYHQRNHICVAHKTADSFLRLGVEVRFCQRCGVAHPLPDFDGLKKSCRKQLAVHNSRRRKAGGSAASSGGAAATSSAAAAAVAAPQAEAEQPVADPAPAPAALAPAALPAFQLQQQEQAGIAEEVELLDALLAPAGSADWAPAGSASMDASPETSVCSASLFGSLPGSPAAEGRGPSWSAGLSLLDEDVGGLGGTAGGGLGLGEAGWAAAADEAPLQLALQLQPAAEQPGGLAAFVEEALGLDLGLPLSSAAGRGAADERVCCGPCPERVCGACRASAPAPSEPAAALAGAGAAPAAAAAAAEPGSAGGLGGAPQPSGWSAAAARPPSGRADDADDTADSGCSLGVIGAAEAAAAAAAEAEAEAAAAAAAAGAAAPSSSGRLPLSAAALERVRQGNAALYSALVRQQLLAAQQLLATANVVLSRQLPSPPPALAQPAAPWVAVR